LPAQGDLPAIRPAFDPAGEVRFVAAGEAERRMSADGVISIS
jgi:hypothetical protein